MSENVIPLRTGIHAFRLSVERPDPCEAIIPFFSLTEIGTKLVEAKYEYDRAFEAHGTDAHAMCRALREMCKSVHELSELVDGLAEGMGR